MDGRNVSKNDIWMDRLIAQCDKIVQGLSIKTTDRISVRNIYWRWNLLWLRLHWLVRGFISGKWHCGWRSSIVWKKQNTSSINYQKKSVLTWYISEWTLNSSLRGQSCDSQRSKQTVDNKCNIIKKKQKRKEMNLYILNSFSIFYILFQ